MRGPHSFFSNHTRNKTCQLRAGESPPGNRGSLPARDGSLLLSIWSEFQRRVRESDAIMRSETVKRIESVLKLAVALREHIKLELEGDAPLQTAQASGPPESLPRVEAFMPHRQTPMRRVHDFQRAKTGW